MRKNNQLSIFILILTGMLSTLCLLTEAIAQDRIPVCPPLGKRSPFSFPQAHRMPFGWKATTARCPCRGVLTPGAQADINIFAPEDLREPGTYQDPCRMAEGMDTVLVAGAPVIDGGVYTGALAGRIVRR